MSRISRPVRRALRLLSTLAIAPALALALTAVLAPALSSPATLTATTFTPVAPASSAPATRPAQQARALYGPVIRVSSVPVPPSLPRPKTPRPQTLTSTSTAASHAADVAASGGTAVTFTIPPITFVRVVAGHITAVRTNTGQAPARTDIRYALTAAGAAPLDASLTTALFALDLTGPWSPGEWRTYTP